MKHLTPEKLAQLSSYPGIIDSHIHLDSQAFASDLDQCLSRAARAGVSRMLLPSTDESSSRRILQLTQQHPQLSGGLGIHPHQAAEFDPQRSPRVWRDFLQQSKWAAIGETGLELHYDFCPLQTQKQSLQAQIELAAETGLPLILHCRLAEEPLYEMLQPWAGKVSGVVHCFTGGWEWALKFLDLGFYIGVGGLVTLPKAAEVHEVAEKVPGDRWLLETDGPYLSPVPFRGFRNESCLLPLVVERIATLRKISAPEVVRQTAENAFSLFRL
ncbi:MAG: TatD family hydrolase [Candidatus Eremiobacteraeota bacterium]|nr:TatD family hydrolase [Candidatus Eremiobacteraeota bacterium]MCW5868978.1 TatD family hydrolase [Candidatus Eremiobacteraeota bacterium]